MWTNAYQSHAIFFLYRTSWFPNTESCIEHNHESLEVVIITTVVICNHNMSCPSRKIFSSYVESSASKSEVTSRQMADLASTASEIEKLVSHLHRDNGAVTCGRLKLYAGATGTRCGSRFLFDQHPLATIALQAASGRQILTNYQPARDSKGAEECLCYNTNREICCLIEESIA